MRLSDEVIQIIRMKNLGRKHSEETKLKMSITRKGKPKTPEHSRKIGESQKGKIVSRETCERISKSKTGKKLSEESRRNISKGKRGIKRPDVSIRLRGSKCHLWKGGISFEPYCVKFSREFKDRVRAFFGYHCVECGNVGIGEKLHVHHVNFNKMSCCDDTIPLFVSLCRSCHAKTNFNRDYWETHFTDMINNYYSGKCYLTVDEMVALNIRTTAIEYEVPA